ncbi:hypothetical protein RFI_38969, partial [Reticulomyxa filosa]
ERKRDRHKVNPRLGTMLVTLAQEKAQKIFEKQIKKEQKIANSRKALAQSQQIASVYSEVDFDLASMMDPKSMNSLDIDVPSTTWRKPSTLTNGSTGNRICANVTRRTPIKGSRGSASTNASQSPSGHVLSKTDVLPFKPSNNDCKTESLESYDDKPVQSDMETIDTILRKDKEAQNELNRLTKSIQSNVNQLLSPKPWHSHVSTLCFVADNIYLVLIFCCNRCYENNEPFKSCGNRKRHWPDKDMQNNETNKDKAMFANDEHMLVPPLKKRKVMSSTQITDEELISLDNTNDYYTNSQKLSDEVTLDICFPSTQPIASDNNKNTKTLNGSSVTGASQLHSEKKRRRSNPFVESISHRGLNYCSINAKNCEFKRIEQIDIVTSNLNVNSSQKTMQLSPHVEVNCANSTLNVLVHQLHLSCPSPSPISRTIAMTNDKSMSPYSSDMGKCEKTQDNTFVGTTGIEDIRAMNWLNENMEDLLWRHKVPTAMHNTRENIPTLPIAINVFANQETYETFVRLWHEQNIFSFSIWTTCQSSEPNITEMKMENVFDFQLGVDWLF